MTTGALGERIDRWQRPSLIVGGVASVGCMIGAIFDWQQFLRPICSHTSSSWGLVWAGLRSS